MDPLFIKNQEIRRPPVYSSGESKCFLIYQPFLQTSRLRFNWFPPGIRTTGVAAMPTAGFARNSLTLRRATSETSMVGIGGHMPPSRSQDWLVPRSLLKHFNVLFLEYLSRSLSKREFCLMSPTSWCVYLFTIETRGAKFWYMEWILVSLTPHPIIQK